MLISRNLHDKSSEVSIKTRSTPASLSFNGQATVKWSIVVSGFGILAHAWNSTCFGHVAVALIYQCGRKDWAFCVERFSDFFVASVPHLLLSTVYQCDGCLSSWGRGGSWLGCQVLPAITTVSPPSPSWSWLPIVEAPGCLGHLRSTQRRSCLFAANYVNFVTINL